MSKPFKGGPSTDCTVTDFIRVMQAHPVIAVRTIDALIAAQFTEDEAHQLLRELILLANKATRYDLVSPPTPVPPTREQLVRQEIQRRSRAVQKKPALSIIKGDKE